VNAGTFEVEIMIPTRQTTGAPLTLPVAGDNITTEIQMFIGTPAGSSAEQVPYLGITGYVQSVSVSAEVDDVVRATVVFRGTSVTNHSSYY
jgi:hypothetical protein